MNDTNNRHEDLRDLLVHIDEMGELKRLQGVSWDLEMGALSEMVCQEAREGKSPVLLFDKVPGYSEGFRVLSGATNSTRRLAYTLGFPEPRGATDVVKAFRDRMRQEFALIPPVEVDQGPILENIDRDEDVDLYKFPVPLLHEKDGGRYIGTDDVVTIRDPVLCQNSNDTKQSGVGRVLSSWERGPQGIVVATPNLITQYCGTSPQFDSTISQEGGPQCSHYRTRRKSAIAFLISWDVGL